MSSLSYAREQARRDKGRLAAALRAEANRLHREAIRDPGAAPCGALAVSDHALVRFLERVMKIDVEAIRAEIARLVPIAARPAPSPEDPDPHGVLVVNGYQFLISPVTLVSVLDESMSAAAWVGRPDRSDFTGDAA